MTEFSWLAKTFAQEHWTPEKRQYVQDQLDQGRRIPEIARELLVPPGQLRTAMRYYRDKTGQTETFVQKAGCPTHQDRQGQNPKGLSKCPAEGDPQTIVPIDPAKRDNHE